MQVNDRVFTGIFLALTAALLVLSGGLLRLDNLCFELLQHLGLMPVTEASRVDAPLWLVLVFSVSFSITPLFFLSRLSQTAFWMVSAVYFFFVLLLALTIERLFQVWVSPSSALLAMLLAYPIWSSRKLASAQRSLDKELQKVRGELASLGMESEDAEPCTTEDLLESGFIELRLTLKHLRDLHKSRSDTLAFISHDIRAPLGTAMLLLGEIENNRQSERIRSLLARAHVMAEGFLQATRAEMANVNDFEIQDMVSLTRQVIDDLYEVMIAKKINVEVECSEETLLVRGDFGLLMRAVSNVFLNAVNYSPESSVIKVTLSRGDSSLSLTITDQGPGIPADRIERLFKRFGRADGLHQAKDGIGLGLYFVDIIIRKHRGSVSVESSRGQGATFIITLPLERRRRNSPVSYDRRAAVEPTFKDIV